MNKITRFSSRTVPLLAANIDTDQIIPARFLKTTSRAGLGRHLFSDWRYDAAGAAKPDFVLNQPSSVGAEILVAGDNFGCGSSREHAPWALTDFGFRAIVSTSIADIFRSNALKNGLLPIVVSPAFHARLATETGAVDIDLGALAITLPDGSKEAFVLDRFSRYCLMNGVDELGFLLGKDADISRFEAGR